MKQFILFLSFLYQAMLCQAQHQIDTLAGAFIYRSTATNTHWILPKSAVMMSLNPNATNDVIGIYTFNNVQIFSGKLSTLIVPGATTNAQKLAFISKNVGTVSGSGGSGSGGTVTFPPNMAKENKQDDAIMRQDVANNNQLIEIINQQKGIDTLSAINQKLTYTPYYNGVFCTPDPRGNILGADYYSYSVCNVGENESGHITLDGGLQIKLKIGECLSFEQTIDELTKKVVGIPNLEWEANNTTYHIFAKLK